MGIPTKSKSLADTPTSRPLEVLRRIKADQPPLFCVRFQAPELDIDVGVAIKVESEKGLELTLPCMAADLVKMCTVTLQEYGHIKESTKAAYCKISDANKEKYFGAEGKLRDHDLLAEIQNVEDGIVNPAIDPVSGKIATSLLLPQQGLGQNGGQNGVADTTRIGGQNGVADTRMTNAMTNTLTRTNNTLSRSENSTIDPKDPLKRNFNDMTSIKFTRSPRELVHEIEKARKRAAVKDSLMETILEKYREQSESIGKMKEDALREVQNLKAQLVVKEKKPENFEFHDVTYLTQNEEWESKGKSNLLPCYDDLLKDIEQRFMEEQLREFAFSNIQTENNKKTQGLKISVYHDGNGRISTTPMFGGEKIGTVDEEEVNNMKICVQNKSYYIHRNASKILRDSIEVQKKLEIARGEYFSQHHLKNLPEPPPPEPVPYYLLGSELRIKDREISPTNNASEGFKKRHSIGPSDQKYIPKPCVFGDMRLGEGEKKSPSHVHLKILSQREESSQNQTENHTENQTENDESSIKSSKKSKSGGRSTPTLKKYSPSKSNIMKDPSSSDHKRNISTCSPTRESVISKGRDTVQQDVLNTINLSLGCGTTALNTHQSRGVQKKTTMMHRNANEHRNQNDTLGLRKMHQKLNNLIDSSFEPASTQWEFGKYMSLFTQEGQPFAQQRISDLAFSNPVEESTSFRTSKNLGKSLAQSRNIAQTQLRSLTKSSNTTGALQHGGGQNAKAKGALRKLKSKGKLNKMRKSTRHSIVLEDLSKNNVDFASTSVVPSNLAALHPNYITQAIQENLQRPSTQGMSGTQGLSRPVTQQGPQDSRCLHGGATDFLTAQGERILEKSERIMEKDAELSREFSNSTLPTPSTVAGSSFCSNPESFISNPESTISMKASPTSSLTDIIIKEGGPFFSGHIPKNSEQTSAEWGSRKLNPRIQLTKIDASY